tara:strand:- start:196 stop:342 length:147 start_codon:yes stop_codon:yes gene_type:complete
MDFTTEQIGRLLCLMRDTSVKKGFIKTNLIEGNEDIWQVLSQEFIRRT